ncbi:MAG: hypothetical protein CSB28_00310 [Desulfobacterales bacterium]|nr:MAG: hypothetical protein CSB28_00310 [Desulfobacterales bacterium]
MTTHLKKILQHQLPQTELQQLTGSYDIVGDIALIRLDTSLQHRATLIGETILQTNSKLKTVVRRLGKHKGEFRTTELAVIAGENRTHTLVREFGLTYELDLASCYFSVRSGTERRRIASLVQKGERVLVLFSGIAPFPLMIAKYSDAELVVGVEKNSDAHHFAKENCVRNRLQHKIRLYCADAARLSQQLFGGKKFHRLIMPLPVGGENFLATALPLLCSGGILHFYAMAPPQEQEKIWQKVAEAAFAQKRTIKKIEAIRAGHCGNNTFRHCFETKIL